ncbi:MAG TPA: hypothetical protein DCG19_09765 [Cryomorphaceae bacterium]|nr:hypothetical protein [Owenweeksia sp.]MBG00171.1 hypothetical protein [Owenweeksia sp.]HAD97680.1 hypothetical protein [Cryomorphaceae bacterium]
MKNLMLLAVAFLGFSAVSLAQSSGLRVKNNTSCYYRIDVEAWDSGCNNRCGNSFICVPPNSAIVIPPCGASSLQWDNIRLTSADRNCQHCNQVTAGYVTSAYGPSCTNFGNSDSETNVCGRCSFTVTFVGPYDLVIN